MPFTGGRLQIQAILISINKERSLRIVGYALAHRLILFLLNALVLDKSLFYSLPVIQRVLFSLFSGKTLLHNHACLEISLLVVGYEEICHAVTTLPFILRVFFFYLNIFF